MVNPRGNAFSLVELLVTITLITLLIALLMPALKSSKDLADRTKCSSNLYQIGIAQGGYAADSRDYPFQYWGHPVTPMGGVYPWYKQAQPYGIVPVEFVCPTYWSAGLPWADPVYGSYAINIFSGYWKYVQNDWLNGVAPRPIAMYKSPSASACFVDRGGDRTFPTGPDSDPYFSTEYRNIATGKYCAGFHQDGFNALFIDGHAKHLTRDTLDALPINDAFFADPRDGW